MIITKTPFRISLFGGGTDMPEWYSKNEGAAISFSIDKFCYLTTRILPPFFDHNFRIAYSIVETETKIENIKHPVVRESIRRFAPHLNLEIHHDGDLPARSGVGSSSAFTVGIIHSLLTLQNIETSKIELANLAIEMEQKVLKENVGSQDQIACALGGLNFISFGPGETWRSEKLTLLPERKSLLEDRIVIIFTGISRISSEINASLMENIDAKEDFLNRLRELAENCKEIFADESDLDQIGVMLDESWKLKRQLNSNSTSNDLDFLYKEALRAGAIGGKLLGAGGGGFFLFWVKAGGKEDFLKHYKYGLHVPISISDEGSQVVYNSIA